MGNGPWGRISGVQGCKTQDAENKDGAGHSDRSGQITWERLIAPPVIFSIFSAQAGLGLRMPRSQCRTAATDTSRWSAACLKPPTISTNFFMAGFLMPIYYDMYAHNASFLLRFVTMPARIFVMVLP